MVDYRRKILTDNIKANRLDTASSDKRWVEIPASSWEVTMGTIFSVDWYVETPTERQDAVWYHGLGAIGLAKLTTDDGKDFTLAISCVGETDVRVPYGDGQDDGVEYVRYAEDWQALGVNTDKEMEALTQKWLEKGTDIWIHNSWFECWVDINGVEEYFDAVSHTLDDAESQAQAILEEVATYGSWEAYFDYLTP